MKNFISLILALFLSINIANANGGTIKNFYAYTIMGHNVREIAPAAQQLVEQSNDRYVHNVSDTRYTWYYYNPNTKETYYYRLYPANNNTDVYIVANDTYNKENNELITFFNQQGYSYKTQKDKSALKEYQFDFYALARRNKLGGFFIAPDCVKPLKICMSKINDRMAKNSKKNAAIPYSEDADYIDLTKIDTANIYFEDAKLDFVVNEYRLKQKANKYVHAYEYRIANQDNTPIVLKQAKSERLASTKDIATEVFVDLDRLDLLDTVGSFPPVLICTCGLSIICSVPNWIRLAKSTAEVTRYAKQLPENYNIAPNRTMRILVLKYKNNPKPINFVFERGQNTYRITY